MSAAESSPHPNPLPGEREQSAPNKRTVLILMRQHWGVIPVSLPEDTQSFP